MIEDGVFYWAKRDGDDNWQPALAVVYSQDDVAFYFPTMEWAVPAFEVGPKIEIYGGSDG